MSDEQNNVHPINPEAENAPAVDPNEHLKKPEKNSTHAFRAWAEIQEQSIAQEGNRKIKAFNAGLEAPHPNETFAWAMEQRIFAHFYMLGCLSFIIDRQNDRIAVLEGIVGSMLKDASLNAGEKGPLQ